MIYRSCSFSGVGLHRSSTSWENPHDSPVAYFTIQFVLIALQGGNCVSSICNQLTASVQLDIPVHRAYVTRVLMGGISFISGHGVKTQGARSGNLACWNCHSVQPWCVCMFVWVCDSIHAHIIMQMENNLKHATGCHAQDQSRALCLNHSCSASFFFTSPFPSSWFISPP